MDLKKTLPQEQYYRSKLAIFRSGQWLICTVHCDDTHDFQWCILPIGNDVCNIKILTLSTLHVRADDFKIHKRFKNVKIMEFCHYIWNHHEKCIQISTNMPGIGLEINLFVEFGETKRFCTNGETNGRMQRVHLTRSQ